MNIVDKNRLVSYTKTQLSNTNAALILMTFPDSRRIRSDLYKQVKGINSEWIQEAPIKEVALRLLGIQIFKPEYLDGELIAKFTKRLMHSELEIGGPYSDEINPELFTNAIIAQLLTNLNVKMPNLTKFLQNEILSHPDRLTLADQWAVLWPNKLINTPTTKHLQGDAIIDLVARICLEQTSTSTDGPSSNVVQEQVRKELLKLDSEVRSTSLKIHKLLCIADKNGEISLLSKYFVESLIEEYHSKSKKITQLGVANFYAWMAYSIYDDFIDDEGRPLYLPTANIMHRNSLITYLKTVSEPQNSFILEAYDLVDTANAWEISNCRFSTTSTNIQVTKIPNYKTGQILADRAYGHILGPLLIADTLNLSQDQKANLEIGLRYYLISRQLSDDIHDWKEDIRNGHVSYIVAFLLNKVGVEQGVYDTAKLISRLERYFWDTGFDLINKHIRQYVDNSLKAFKTSGVISLNGPFLNVTLGPIQKSIFESKDIMSNQKKFLEFYN